ncbi:MAG: ABC transporter ATP-binding protein [Planctomycetota bacterium]
MTVAEIASPALRARARRLIGFMPESEAVYPEMSVDGFLRYRCELFGIARRDARSRVGGVLERCALGDVSRRRVGTLSKGYRQRVVLAATLLHEPRVIVLDEPTSGLDPAQVRAFRGVIRSLAEDRVVLLSTHVLAEIEAIADRVIVLQRGRLVHDGPVHAEIEDASPLTVRCAAAAGASPEQDAARLAGSLLSVGGVTRVEALGASEGWHELRVFVEAPGHAAAAEVSAKLAELGRPPAQVTRERPTLESRFFGLLDHGSAGAEAAGTGGTGEDG